MLWQCFYFLLLNGMESAVNSESVFAYIIYFVCHFVIAAILILHSFQKWTLSTNSLFILLFIAVCLPLWMVFCLIKKTIIAPWEFTHGF